jgi:hypothetical protein
VRNRAAGTGSPRRNCRDHGRHSQDQRAHHHGRQNWISTPHISGCAKDVIGIDHHSEIPPSLKQYNTAGLKKFTPSPLSRAVYFALHALSHPRRNSMGCLASDRRPTRPPQLGGGLNPRATAHHRSRNRAILLERNTGQGRVVQGEGCPLLHKSRLQTHSAKLRIQHNHRFVLRV